jgi:hypothetical protein
MAQQAHLSLVVKVVEAGVQVVQTVMVALVALVGFQLVVVAVVGAERQQAELVALARLVV